MSGTGNCHVNAVTESFFGTLKSELVCLTKYQTRPEAKYSIFEYIECFYNRKRKHSALGYLSPAEYENQWKLTIPRVHFTGQRSYSLFPK
ncbi:MAG: IS3 family transposase [Candidatus Lokiarchaeota archaeon]|nr:IS3 family transposase [Candidatus Lokiarchaeota archaeon]